MVKVKADNQLRGELGRPVEYLKAHEAVCFHQGEDMNALTVSFKRTIRVPEDGKVHALPPNLGFFPLYNVSHYADTLPKGMTSKGGCFMPVHEREALWIRFESTRPFGLKVYLGSINAISGEPLKETFASTMRRQQRFSDHINIQDYAVIDPAAQGQLWLDGIANTDGTVMQFVAVSSGTGYSVEAQIAKHEAVCGIQIIVAPIKRGAVAVLKVHRLGQTPLFPSVQLNATVYELMNMISATIDVPVEQFYLLHDNVVLEKNYLLSHYGITAQNSTLHLVLHLQGGGLVGNPNLPSEGEMGIAAGGLIRQAILRDPHASEVWDCKNVTTFFVQLLNANLLELVTSIAPPPSPITAELYAAAGLPFFSLPDEPKTGIYGKFSGVKSIGQMDVAKGKKKGLDRELKFPVIKLDRSGKHLFRPVGRMEALLKGMGFAGS
ncbi:uncharacterized protein LY89DRAFT_682890 [Mollisia scopiformis]|uniref:Ubiquitin-like domain-containing protein n=1 Tax=Mollisia scopiformis TaxID=149040 RepID=A0A194XJZ3_MOLSC|nr:uncharacterized protein LY89DRAFT_682890 [Mollisia scopiformis]KUJ20107.1 hypothetical protein LY89DRAFT_682890 [Mollisia scopiformis]